jgi:hypothetical protein
VCGRQARTQSRAAQAATTRGTHFSTSSKDAPDRRPQMGGLQ